MRRYLFVLPLIIACARAETPSADSAAAAASAGLTEADVAGTWTGTFTPDGDTTRVPWTDVCGGGTCRLVTAPAPNDTIVSTYTIQGDSVVGVSSAYADTSIVKGAMVVDHWVARPRAGQLTGSGRMVLADRPDSVVLRYTFQGSRNP